MSTLAATEEIISNDPDLSTWLLIANTRHAMLQALGKEYVPFRISPGQAHVLRIIHNLGDKATLTQISRSSFRELHTLSARITRMEKKGLLKKTRPLHGTNQIGFELTPQGLEAYEFCERRAALKKIVSVLSEQERQQLTSCMNKLLIEAQKLY